MKSSQGTTARGRPRLLSLAIMVTLAVWLMLPAGTASAREGRRWFGTWTASPQPPYSTGISAAGFSDQTLRLIVHTSISGSRVRIRLSNVFGTQPLTIGSAMVGVRDAGPSVVPGTSRALTFGGGASVTIPSGQEVISDPVRLRVDAEQDLAVTLFVPAASGPTTFHNVAKTTSYYTDAGSGDRTSELTGASFRNTTDHWFWLDGVDVVHPSETGAIVTLGDSITDGVGSTTDANHRWPDYLARRLLGLPASQQKSVLDEGISGNRILNPSECCGVSALDRLSRDVLQQTGVTDVILLEGINDIGFSQLTSPRTAPHTDVSAAQIIAGYQRIIAAVHARGLKIFGGTLTPFEGAGYYYLAGEVKREAVNQWIRTSGQFDGVIDFDAAVRDPADPLRFFPLYDSGDHLHPSDLGYQVMANAIDLALFRDRPVGHAA
ncbi:MAG TPA: SGNH/GDSL hydrolase family protein [Actinomycetes bacterium]|nr:SGNH/GDSL hydrolase family protein [Actinomycetes bacterium]